MKVLVVSQYFYPENFRINELCKDLKEKGHEITVLTGKPNYPKGVIYESYTKFGNDDEIWEDIRIIRAPLIPRGKGALNLVLNYISFAIFGSSKAKKLREEKYNVIYIFGISPITAAYPAILLKKKTGIPIIMNIQDLWPESVVSVTKIKNKLIINLVGHMVNHIYSKCDLILTSSNAFISKVRERVNGEKSIRYWPQYSNVIRKPNYKLMFNTHAFNIVFTGNIGVAQNLELVIEAANKLRESNIRWHIVGDGRNKENLVNKVNEMNLEEYVKFYDSVKEEFVPDYLQSADAALLILKPEPIFDLTLPAKLQTYLACGCSVLGCVNGESKRVIEEANAGIVCDAINVDELVNKALYMSKLSKGELSKYGENAIEYNELKFNKNKLVNELTNYMENI